MKKIWLASTVLLLAGCTNASTEENVSNNSSGNTPVTYQESSVVESIVENNEHFVTFTSGVSKDNVINGDSQNFANISGDVPGGTGTVYVVDGETGLVHGIEVLSNGKFDMSFNMQGINERELIFTTDDLDGLVVEDLESIVNKVLLTYLANPNADSSEINELDQSSSQIGDTVTFTTAEGAQMDVTIDSVIKSLGNERNIPNGPFYAQIQFTFSNSGNIEIDVNSHLFEFYDSENFKGELVSWEYFSETLKPGKSAKGIANFDIISDGETFEVYFADTSWTGEYQHD